jgi:putative membrane-bound dehydrogenase-like protein
MNRVVFLARAWLVVAAGAGSLVVNAAETAPARPVRALLVAGGCCHDYLGQHKALFECIQAKADVQVDVYWTDDRSTNPPLRLFESADWSKGYDVVIHDECAADNKDMPAFDRIMEAHKTIPAVHLHCAMHSFRNGTDRWFRHLGLQSTGHGPQEPISVGFVDREHPISKTLTDWVTGKEELYNNVKVFDAHPLAIGRQTVVTKTGESKVEECVVAWTTEREGLRSFSTTLGHNTATVADPRYVELVTRGLLWACRRLDDGTLGRPFTGKNEVTFVKGAPPKPAAAANPGPTPADATVVVAKASSTQPGNDAWRACDGNEATRWCAAGGGFPQSWQIELDGPHTVTGIRIVWEQAGTVYAHAIETSVDGAVWTVAQDARNGVAKGTNEHAFAPVEARHVRVTCLGSSGGWASIREVSLKAEGITRIHPKLDEAQQKAAAAEKAEADRAANDPYAKQGNAPPRSVKLTAEREQAILKDVSVADGFDVTVFAAPPAVNYPVFVAAAPGGTLYVSSDGNGSLGRDPGRGRVIRLRDTDGDNRADETKVFCEVDSPRGLVWDHDRLYLVHPPHLSVFLDTDGDGVADDRKILVKNLAFGFDKRPADHTTNGLSLGIDGWLYIAGGDFGFMEAEGTDGRRLTHRGGGVIRVRPDGSGLEVVSTGTRNILEVAVSPSLEMFARDNTNDGGGWNVRFHHFTGLDDHGYPRLYKNFADECVPPLADYGGGSGCGATYIDEPGFGEWNDAPFTADWGTGALYRHGVRPKGATFEEMEKPRPFIRMPRPTDADIDGMSRLYCASWKGATFKWEGADVGYIVCVTPRGFTPQPLPDFGAATEPKLVELASMESTAGHRRRLEAERELARRGIPRAGMVAAALERRRTPERNLVERFRQIVAANDGSRVSEIIAEVGSADPVVAHTAVRALAALGAADATLAALDMSVAADRGPLLRSLAMMHRPDVVSSLEGRLATSVDSGLRMDLLGALCRLHFLEGKWKGDSWGTRPDTRGPYYQPEPWSETPRIASLLVATLEKASPEEAAFLVREMRHNRIPGNGAIERIIALAEKDSTLIPDAAAELAQADDVPPAAVPLLLQAVGLQNASPQTLAHAIAALCKTDGDAGVRASPAGLVRLEAIVAERVAAKASHAQVDEARKKLEEATAAFIDSRRLDQHHESLEQDAAALKPASRWADAALLRLSCRDSASPEARESASKALDAGWQASPERRVQILRAAALVKHREWVGRILAALDDAEPAVRQAAAATAESLAIKQVKDATPTLASVPPDDALAAVLAARGDEATGELVFARATCTTCHTVRQEQPQKGPYLGTIAKTYRRRELAEAILNPNKTIAQGFVSEVFIMQDGTQHTGYVSLQAADEVRIRNATGQELSLRAADIDERHKLATSMMPTGLMTKFTTREFASLLDYIESLSKGK